jgi:hypothetical protein
MKHVGVVLIVVFSAAQVSGPPPFPVGKPTKEAPIGILGYRIGTYLAIEGTQFIEPGTGKHGTHDLLVDTIGGYKLEKPVTVWIDNVDLPANERCVFKGYEYAHWIGLPDEVRRIRSAAGKPAPQAAWQCSYMFIVVSIDQPKSIEIKNR